MGKIPCRRAHFSALYSGVRLHLWRANARFSEMILLHFIPDLVARHVEKFGRVGLVPSGALEGLLQQLLFDFLYVASRYRQQHDEFVPIWAVCARMGSNCKIPVRF